MIHHPSPNFGPRRLDARPDMVVLHFTDMVSSEAALARLCDPAAEVSAHYLVGRDGRCWQMVDEAMRAWHAGSGAWGAVTDVNSRSIGIELDNCGAAPFPEPQMAVLERLLAGLLKRWQIPPERVIGHSDMAPARKVDPGPRFDWRRLARAGLSVWPQGTRAAPADPLAFTEAATRFGYGRDLDEATRLAAVRLRFRPWAEGPLSPDDVAAITDLAARFPVDRARASA